MKQDDGIPEITQKELFDMMAGEYEFDPNHNQEHALHAHLCEIKEAWDKQRTEKAKALEILKEWISRPSLAVRPIAKYEIKKVLEALGA